MKIAAIIFMLLGFFLTAVAVAGVLRFPDFYTRLHASGKVDSLGVSLTLLGLAIYNGISLTSLKIIFIAVFVLVANPIGTHLLARAAYQSGIVPWTKKEE